MTTIIINGKAISVGGGSVSVVNGKVFVGGKPIDGDTNAKEIHIVVEGDITGNLQVDNCDSIEVKGSVGGKVSGGATVTVGGDVRGDVHAGNGVTVSGTVTGDVRAGNSVHCGDIGGSAHAGNSIYRKLGPLTPGISGGILR